MCAVGATCGPFTYNPLSTPPTVSPLQIALSRSGKSQLVVDLSFPRGTCVNDAIPKDSYLDAPLSLRLPGIDALVNITIQKGTGCLLFKKELRHAYRQLRFDPRDYHLLGFQHQHALYFDVAPPFGLRSTVMMCQRTTSVVTFMFRALGFDCTNYIDDFCGAEIPESAATAFHALGDLLSALGLQSSPGKDCPPSTHMNFLGIALDTAAMTLSVTPDRLSELLDQCRSLLRVDSIPRRQLQSLLGVMSFVTACVRPARIFMSSLHTTLRSHSSDRFC